MTPLEILRAARAKIEKPENWCQRFPAKNEYGNPTHPGSSQADSWCAFGAIHFVGGWWPEAKEARKELDKQAPFGCAVAFNDTRTHAEVLGLFDKAIGELESKEKET